MKIYLISQAESIGPKETQHLNHLSEKGKQQARALGQKLSSREIQKIFTGPLPSALETTQLMNQTLNTNYKIVADLQDEQGQNGEDEAAFKERILSIFAEICNTTMYNTIAFVMHTGALKNILKELLQQQGDAISDAAVIEIEKRKEKMWLVKSE